ncbi:iron permease [Gautieria morchelliformis]|nr:iron permease [Gautieria morchelliformis]
MPEPEPVVENPSGKETSAAAPERGIRFWMAIVCLMLSTFLAALDTTSVATALPTIIDSLQGSQFAWIGSAYTLAAVATIPSSGNLANLFGRRSVLLVYLLVFALGSALCGAAQSMAMLIGGRTVQGAGAGGILSLTEIILSDLVPLHERGAYQGMIGLVWSIAGCLGPPVGGAFASRKDWTWRGLFYLNLPLTGIAIVACIFCLNLKAPRSSLVEKLQRIDWIGNFIIIAASVSTLLGLTWGGIQFGWATAQVLVPLIVGLFGIVVWIIYEALVPNEPILPLRLFNNRTTISGYVGTAIHGLVVSAALFYLPVYFQACKGASPVRSGVDLLPYSFSIAPFAIVAGATASATKKYRIQNVAAWCFIMIGLGLQTTLHVTSATRNWVGFEILAGIGLGLLFTATTFPILSPLPVSDNATALSLFIFIRSFFQAWGITIGATVLQNQLKRRLPQQFLANLPQGIDLSYAAIPQIAALSDTLKPVVQKAFADSLRILWFVLLGISVVGLLSSLLMKEVEMQTVTDERWGLTDEGRSQANTNAEAATPEEKA